MGRPTARQRISSTCAPSADHHACCREQDRHVMSIAKHARQEADHLKRRCLTDDDPACVERDLRLQSRPRPWASTATQTAQTARPTTRTAVLRRLLTSPLACATTKSHSARGTVSAHRARLLHWRLADAGPSARGNLPCRPASATLYKSGRSGPALPKRQCLTDGGWYRGISRHQRDNLIQKAVIRGGNLDHAAHPGDHVLLRCFRSLSCPREW